MLRLRFFFHSKHFRSVLRVPRGSYDPLLLENSSDLFAKIELTLCLAPQINVDASQAKFLARFDAMHRSVEFGDHSIARREKKLIMTRGENVASWASSYRRISMVSSKNNDPSVFERPRTLISRTDRFEERAQASKKDGVLFSLR